MSVRFLADEDLDGRVLVVCANLAKAYELQIDVVRVQDVGLMGASDPSILQWAARNNRVVLTHDRRTMVPYAWDRLAVGLPMAGVVLVRSSQSPGDAGHAIANEIALRDRENRGWDNEVVWLGFEKAR